MAETYTTYITRQNERWDIISHRTLGDPYGYEPIILANPQYRSLLKLPAGTKLRIPEVTTTVSVPTESLPPWRK